MVLVILVFAELSLFGFFVLGLGVSRPGKSLDADRSSPKEISQALQVPKRRSRPGSVANKALKSGSQTFPKHQFPKRQVPFESAFQMQGFHGLPSKVPSSVPSGVPKQVPKREDSQAKFAEQVASCHVYQVQ